MRNISLGFSLVPPPDPRVSPGHTWSVLRALASGARGSELPWPCVPSSLAASVLVVGIG